MSGRRDFHLKDALPEESSSRLHPLVLDACLDTLGEVESNLLEYRVEPSVLKQVGYDNILIC